MIIICAIQRKGDAVFGYIKPYVQALTVAEFEAYKGAYCGLCRTMGALTGQASRLTLNYDLAFLALFRMAAERIPSSFSRRGCVAHPVSHRNIMKRNPALEYAAAASAVLTAGKIADNANDERGFKRLGAKMISPYGRCMVRRVRKRIAELDEAVSGDLEAIAEIEDKKVASLDEPAAAFGTLLARVASFGYEGDLKLIAEEMGRRLGKIIYVFDAAEDLADDVKDEKYNPLALLYEKPYEEGAEDKRPLLKKEIADGLYSAIGIEANRAAAAFELIDEAGIGTYKGVIMNVLTLGIRAEAERILYGRGKAEDPVKFRV